jgi:ATP-dependent Lon protease
MTQRRVLDVDPIPSHRLSEALEELPLFPLPEVTLFPRAIMPLHVFEPRYRTMLRDALQTHGALAIVQLVPGETHEGDTPPIARIAGAGLVIEHEPLPGARSNILVQGTARVALEELPFEGPYRRARARILDEHDVIVPEADVAALMQMATSFASEVRRRDPHFSFRLPETLSPSALADICAFRLVIDPEVRQAALEELDPRARIHCVLDELSAQRLALGGASSSESDAN